MAAQTAFRVEPQMGRKARPVVAGNQRTPAVGDVLRQHRHDPVREVDRVAALEGGPIERTTGPHVPGDVGNRDEQVPAAGVGRIGVSVGPDRVIEIAGVLAVDRHQRDVAQILPVAERRRSGGRGLRERGVGKAHRDVVVVNGNQADRPRSPRRSAALDDFRAAQPQRPALIHLGPDELARLGAKRINGRDLHLLATSAIDRKQAPASANQAVDSERAHRPAVQLTNNSGLVAAVGRLAEPRERPVALHQRRTAAPVGHDRDLRRRRFLRPRDRSRRQLAVDIDIEDLKNGHRRQPPGPAKAPALVAPNRTRALKVAQDLAQFDLLLGVEAEGTGQFPLADPAGARLNVFEDLLATGQRRGSGFGGCFRQDREASEQETGFSYFNPAVALP